MRTTLTAVARAQEDAFVSIPALGGGGTIGSNAVMARFRNLLKRIVQGSGLTNRAASRPKVRYSTQPASARVTLSAVLAADTVTLNGVALAAVSGAPANNQFDISGTDVAAATSLVAAIHASTSPLVSGALVAGNRAAVVTLASVTSGDFITLAGVQLLALAGVTDSGGNRVTTNRPGVWSMAGTDTVDAVSLANAINAHPVLRSNFLATSAAAVVTIRERNPAVGDASILTSSNAARLAVTGAAGYGLLQATATVLVEAFDSGVSGNQATIATSNGTRLAITGDATGRLAGGTSTTLTY